VKPFSSILELRNYIGTTFPVEIIEGIPRYLFRGENQYFPETKSSIGRLAEKHRDCVGYAQRLYMSIHHDLTLLDGYNIGGAKEATALLQHYSMPTPQIDLSGNFDVAIYFATENTLKDFHDGNFKEAELPRVFIIDTTKIPSELEIINHDFLITKDLVAAAKHRYFRQDGYAITTKDNMQTDIVLSFDLKKIEYQDFVQTITFVPLDRENILLTKNYIYDDQDFIPAKIQSILRMKAMEFELDDNPFPPHLIQLIDKIYPQK
jgi:hypothetical protein